MREDLEHERGRSLDFVGNVNRLISDLWKDRTEFSFAELEMSGHSFLYTASWGNIFRIFLGFARRYPSFRRGLRVSTASTSILWRFLSARAYFTGRSPYL